MTLIELMVALAILSLSAALAFANIGPWLAQSRASANEAAFWRSAAPAQLLLSELAAGAIDPTSRQVMASQVRFRALAPRLSLTPIAVTLEIVTEGNTSRLIFSTPQLSSDESVILDHAPPLRFADGGGYSGALVLEARRGNQWAPLASASFATDAPFVCAFDPIPRTCR